jgi:hypothetical protein
MGVAISEEYGRDTRIEVDVNVAVGAFCVAQARDPPGVVLFGIVRKKFGSLKKGSRRRGLKPKLGARCQRMGPSLLPSQEMPEAKKLAGAASTVDRSAAPKLAVSDDDR